MEGHEWRDIGINGGIKVLISYKPEKHSALEPVWH